MADTWIELHKDKSSNTEGSLVPSTESPGLQSVGRVPALVSLHGLVEEV